MIARISRIAIISTALSSVWLTTGANAEPFRHKFGELREYHKHWLAVCPDRFDAKALPGYERQCWASTFDGKPGFQFDNRLTVIRDRVNNSISITTVTSTYDKLDKSQPVAVRFSDGTRMDFAFGTSVKPAQSINEFRLAVENTPEMIAAMKRTNWMKLTFPTTDGPVTTSYSMIGLTSALSFTKIYARPQS